MFEILVREAAARYGLGDKALPMLQIVLQYMTGGGSRGLAAFLEQFKDAGLGPTVQSWLGGGPAAKPISNEDLERVLGSSDGLISTLTHKLALERDSVTSALGYLLPALVGKLTPGGSLPSRIPAEVQALAAEGKRQLEAPASRTPQAKSPAGGMKWLPWIIVALAVVLGLGYCSTRDKGDEAASPAAVEESQPSATTGDDAAGDSAPDAQAEPGTTDGAASTDDDVDATDTDAGADATADVQAQEGAFSPDDDADAAAEDTDADAAAGDSEAEDDSGAAADEDTDAHADADADADEDDVSGAADDDTAGDEAADDAQNGDEADAANDDANADEDGVTDDDAADTETTDDADDSTADADADGSSDDGGSDTADQADEAASTPMVEAFTNDDKPALKVFFDSGDATVPAGFSSQTAELVDYLNAHDDAQVTVAGYTDASGSAQLNEDLSKQRAQAVRAALVMAGVAEDRINMEKPQQISDDEEQDKAASRRVEVTIED